MFEYGCVWKSSYFEQYEHYLNGDYVRQVETVEGSKRYNFFIYNDMNDTLLPMPLPSTKTTENMYSGAFTQENIDDSTHVGHGYNLIFLDQCQRRKDFIAAELSLIEDNGSNHRTDIAPQKGIVIFLLFFYFYCEPNTE